MAQEEVEFVQAWLDVGDADELNATVDSLPPPEAFVTRTVNLAAGPPGGDPQLTTDEGPAFASPASEEELPSRLGRYDVIEKLGEGGMGVVFAALDENLRRRVAVKHGGSFEDDPAGKQRFVLEAQVTAQLEHPGIVPVYSLEAGKQGGVAYAMKVVRGVELADRIAEAQALRDRLGPEAPELRELQRTLVEKLIRVCETMHFAHMHGAIHRDLKPENLMLGAYQEVYVMDWGLAKTVGVDDLLAEYDEDAPTIQELNAVELPADTQTMAGSIKGTPIYMAPEQARGESSELGPACDVYCLGMILHEVFYLQRARPGRTLLEVIEAARKNELKPPPPELDLDPEVRAIVARATQSKAEDRYRTAEALGEDLRNWLQGEETAALPDEGVRKVRRWVRQHPHRALGALGGTVLAALLLFAGQLGWQQIQRSRERARSEHRERVVQTLRSRAELGRDRIARHFLYYGSLSASLTASTVQVLEHAEPLSEPCVYPPQTFAQFLGAPAGTALAPAFGGRIVAPRAFVGRGAPGADPAELRRAHGLLSHLLEPCREVFLAGKVGSLARWKQRSPEEIDRTILSEDLPLIWVYVALEQAGAIALFPGAQSKWGEDYDARQRSWYREAKASYEEQGKRRNWSQPYLDGMGQGLVLTCTEVVLSPAGEFEGVVAMDLSFEEAAKSYLAWEDLPGFRRATLVEDSGEVFMDLAKGEPKLRDDGTLDLGRYDDATALAAIEAGRVDHLVRGQLLTLWVRAPTLGWTLVADVELPKLEAALKD